MIPKVAIILVNYNGYKDTLECVHSLQNMTYKNATIFIVDNASTEEEKVYNDSYLLNAARIIQSKENIGFSGGNNMAIEVALKEDYDYVLLLNNDTTVEPDFLTELVRVAQKDSELGIVAGKIYFYYDRERVWSAGGHYGRITGVTLQFGGSDRKEISIEKDVTFATGCLALIPCTVIRKIGMMDESFFLYSEDSEYCQRVIDNGYRIRYVPTSKIYHKVSATVGDCSLIQQRYMIRNNLYMVKRYGKIKLLAYMGVMVQALKNIVRGRRKIKPTIQGIKDYALGKTGKIEVI